MHPARVVVVMFVAAFAISALSLSCSQEGSEPRTARAPREFVDAECYEEEVAGKYAAGPAAAPRREVYGERTHLGAGAERGGVTEEEYRKAAKAPRRARFEAARDARDKTRHTAAPMPAPVARPQAPVAVAETPARPATELPPVAHDETPGAEGRYSATEFFKSYGVNPFVDTSEDRLSTFAVDVDTASYTIARRYIKRGQLPPKQAVRIEEFVNYFRYFYKPPKEDAFAIYIEGAPSWFGAQNHRLLKIGIKGREIKEKDRKDALLTFVVDVSGSMREGGKLEQAKSALCFLLDQMREGDRVGIITYNQNARVITEPRSIRHRDYLLSAIQGLRPGGTTNAQAGLRLGYEMAEKHFDKACINRIIFCSDGVANVGATSAEAILGDVKTPDHCGIYLTTVGFGVDNYNDTLLEQLADKGDGNYSYVDSAEAARKIFAQELTGTLQVIAKDVKIQVDFDPEVVKRYRLLGYENRAVADSKFRDDREDGGEIGAGHSVTALYEIEPRGKVQGKLGTVYIRYKDPETGKVAEVKREVRAGDFTASFHEATENFRLAAAVAEFAEILRGSYWARSSKLSEVYRLAKLLAPEFDNREDVVEFVGLAATAAGLRGESIEEESEVRPAGTSAPGSGQSRAPAGPGTKVASSGEPSLWQVLPLVLIAFGLTLGRVAYLHGFRRYRPWSRLPVLRGSRRRRRGRR